MDFLFSCCYWSQLDASRHHGGHYIQGVLSILLDYSNKPLSSQDARWPAIKQRSRTSITASSPLHTRSKLLNLPFPYLQVTPSPAVSHLRAFSTTTASAAEHPYQLTHIKKSSEAGPDDSVGSGYRLKALRADTIRDRSMLQDVVANGVEKSPLPPSLEEVRQKKNMAGPEFHEYWQRAAESKLSKSLGIENAHRKAQRLLHKAGLKGVLDHRALMSEAQGIAEKTWRAQQSEWISVTQNAAQEKHKVKEKNLKGLLEEVETPQASDRLLRRIESKIDELENRIARVAVEKPDASANEKHQTKRARWRERKEAERWAADPNPNKGKVEQKQELSEVESLLNSYKEQVVIIKQQAEMLEDVRRRKVEMLSKKRALVKQLEEQERAEQEAKIVAKQPEVKMQERRPYSFDLDEILDDAMDRTRKPPQEPETQENDSQPVSTATNAKLLENSSDLMKKVGAGSVSVLDRSTARDSAAKRKAMKTGEILSNPIIEAADMDASVIVPSDESTEDVNVFGSTIKPKSLPPNWPLSQNRSLQTQHLKREDTHLSASSEQKPSDNLRLHVSPAGFIPIDSDLVVTFEALVPSLQSQVLQMQQRLKSSYPRIDTLPYDVWTSDNKNTLQTWLKILVSRWQTRFEDVEKTGQIGKGVMDERVKIVLDQMVKDHDLSNEAAERMAMRWHEVFEERGSMDGDAEGGLDWDEFRAGGMGFLREEHGHQDGEYYQGVQQQQQQEEGKPTPLVAQDRRPHVWAKTDGPTQYDSITRRLYSTTVSQPPLDPPASTTPNEAQPAYKSPPHQQEQPSLPHLTPTGSAHMVSVSTKAHTIRTAIAVGTVYFSNPTPLALIRNNSLKKGDVLAVSRIAGIMAAKKCPEIVPLCHPIALSHVGVELYTFGPDSRKGGCGKQGGKGSGDMGKDNGGVHVEAKVECTGPTGVEMEALTAIMGATLSVLDMCKAVDRFQRVAGVRVVLKEGGKSGVWREEGWVSLQK
ncbi:MoaC-domain-containing protein [Clathrospora elynae]|uniref:cyclic pyranopterin monophosphate synthase n=1 Tax=Clathrospora elynae TaxID=706981 RepID=A0A6A5STG0_9PLEO|nr:MoaC-domain-containing protein [Clathrospora elynae]